MRKLTLGAIALLALTACGGGNGNEKTEPAATATASPMEVAEPSVVPDARYGTVEALRDAAVDSGYVCEHWKTTNVVSLAAESGRCSGADVFSTFASDGDLQSQLDTFKGTDDMLADAGLPPDPHLVGPNWIITGADVPPLQPALGGTIVSPTGVN